MRNNMRKGFTIIEVILMMSILAIILPTLPLLVFKSANAIKELKDTQYYAHGYTATMLTANKLWDENNVNDVSLTGKYYVLNSNSLNNQNPNLNCVNNYRNGHYRAKNRRKCSTTGSIVSAIGMDAGESVFARNLDDIDDFNNTSYRLIAEDKVNANLLAEITLNAPAGVDPWDWIKQILSEPYNDSSPAADITAIATKYAITEALVTKWFQTLANVKIETSVEFVDYSILANVINTEQINTTGDTTDIKRITVRITDLQEKEQDVRKVITYYYYATNIGTDIPLVKVNN